MSIKDHYDTRLGYGGTDIIFHGVALIVEDDVPDGIAYVNTKTYKELALSMVNDES